MYKHIKNCIISPKYIYKTRNDNGWKSFGYLLLLSLIVALPVLISLLKFDGFSPAMRNDTKNLLYDELNIDCELGDKLVCSEGVLKEIELLNYKVIIDPSAQHTVADFGFVVVLREDVVYFYSATVLFDSIPYTELPTEWNGLDFNVEDDAFWDSFFDGLDSLIMGYRNLWLPVGLIAAYIANIITVVLLLLFDTLIIKIFSFTKLKFRQIFKMLINAMTLYVIIRLIILLYGVSISSIIISMIQVIPLIYVLMAIRTMQRR